MTKTRRRKMSAAQKASLAGAQARLAKPVKLHQAPWDHGATGPANVRSLVVEDRPDVDEDGLPVKGSRITGARRVDHMDAWLSAGQITVRGYNAGCRLRNAFEQTQRSKPSFQDNDRVQSSPKPDHAVAIMTDRISAFREIAKLIPSGDWALVSSAILDGVDPGSMMRHFSGALDRLADALEVN